MSQVGMGASINARQNRAAIMNLDPEALSEAWRTFKITGDRDIRNDLALHYTSLVRYVAAKVASGLPNMVERDDLISYGTFGLLDAIEKYDPARGIKFETYAVSRIKGSIIDELRALDWVPRTIRSKARDVDRVQTELQTELGRPPEDGELADRLGITVSELWVLVSQASATAVTGLEENSGDEDRLSVSEVAYDVASNPEDLFMASEISEMVANAVNTMTERSKALVYLYYLSGMTLAEIGEVLGVTESRVCQLQSKMLASLREALGQGATVAA